MTRSIYVKEIITILKDPLLCPRCNKEDKLEVNLIQEKISNGKTFFCGRCEAVTIVTNLNLRRVDLQSKNDDLLMLKEPYLIRKVGY